MFYYKTQHKEVNFVVLDGNKPSQLMQVTYELGAHNAEREINSLAKASKELKTRNLLVITWDQEDEIKVESLK